MKNVYQVVLHQHGDTQYFTSHAKAIKYVKAYATQEGLVIENEDLDKRYSTVDYVDVTVGSVIIQKDVM